MGSGFWALGVVILILGELEQLTDATAPRRPPHPLISYS